MVGTTIGLRSRTGEAWRDDRVTVFGRSRLREPGRSSGCGTRGSLGAGTAAMGCGVPAGSFLSPYKGSRYLRSGTGGRLPPGRREPSEYWNSPDSRSGGWDRDGVPRFGTGSELRGIDRAGVPRSALPRVVRTCDRSRDLSLAWLRDIRGPAPKAGAPVPAAMPNRILLPKSPVWGPEVRYPGPLPGINRGGVASGAPELPLIPRKFGTS